VHSAQRAEAAEDSDRLVLEVMRAPPGVAPETVRTAVARELGVDVALGTEGDSGRGLIRVVVARRRATVSFASRAATDGAGGTVARTIDLPARPSTAVDMIALLAGNLVRDEASALVDELRKRAAARTEGAGSGDAAGEMHRDAAANEDGADAAAEAPRTAPAEMPVPAADESPRPVRGIAEPPRAASPCERRIAPFPIGVDLVPFVGTSSVPSMRRATRAFGLGAAGGLGATTRGADVGGAASLLTSGLCGAQVGGALALTVGPVRGAQLAGALSLTVGDVRGLQAAPVTVATADLFGVQVGVANIGGARVRGAQVGLVNVAGEADVQVGLVSLQRHGQTFAEASVTDSALTTVAVVHGGRFVHNLYGVGARTGAAGARVALSLGIGVRFVDEERWTLDLDAISHGLARPDDLGTWSQQAMLRASVGVRLSRRAAVFGGLTYNALITEDASERPQTPFPLTQETSTGGTSVMLWPGIALGVRLFGS
jgi:hypothetical protein